MAHCPVVERRDYYDFVAYLRRLGVDTDTEVSEDTSTNKQEDEQVAQETKHWHSASVGQIITLDSDNSGFSAGEELEVRQVEYIGYTGRLPLYVQSRRSSRAEWLHVDANDDIRFTVVAEAAADEDAGLSDQAVAIKYLGKMLEAAEHYRSTGERINSFYPYIGICDNIERMSPSAHSDKIGRVKDNLICRTPSFSGHYNYPVPSASGSSSAENAWDYSEDKWSGDYGNNRVQQLRELLHLVKTEWGDDLIERKSPARRHGLVEGDLVVYNGERWKLTHDDGSANPGFQNIATGRGEYLWLNEIKKVVDLPKRSVKSLVKSADKVIAKMATVEAEIEKLQAELRRMQADLEEVDAALLRQHKVRRA